MLNIVEFLEDFCLYLGYWPIIFLCYFFWSWYHGNSGLIGCLRVFFSVCFFLRVWEKLVLVLKRLEEYTNKVIWSGLLLTATAKLLQSCPTLCDPIDGSPPGSYVPRILQARTLEWVAISFSNAWKWKVKVKSLSRVPLFATLWTVAYQAAPSMGFSRQEYWSGVPLPSPLLVERCWLLMQSPY